jgi:hypothetical protein
MDFQERLQKAIQRGQKQRDKKTRAAREKAFTEEEFKSQHSGFRLQLSEHIENCLQQIPQQFPGFRFEIIYGERGWGGACYRDDVGVGESGKRANFYSRIEMTIRPFSSFHVIELASKATVRNKEIFNRTHYEELTDADPEKFVEMIDLWILEFAEMYAARGV